MLQPSDSMENNTLEEKNEWKGCSFKMMLLLCAPRMAMNMAWAAQWGALGPLLDALFPNQSWAVKLVQCIGPITGILVTPTIGVLSDNCTSKYGRRRPFLLAGAVATVLCWLVMMNAETFGNWMASTKSGKVIATKVLVVLTYLWMDISVNVMQVPAVLIIADFAGDRQLLASSVAQIYSITGGLIVSGWMAAYGAAHKAGNYQNFFYVLIGVVLATVLPVCYFVKETVYVPDTLQTQQRQFKRSLHAVYNSFRYLPKALGVFFVCIVLLQGGYSTYNSTKSAYFGSFVLEGDADGTQSCCDSIICRPGVKPCTPSQIKYLDGVKLANGLIDTFHSVIGLIWVGALPFLVNVFGCRRVFLWSIIPQLFLGVLFFCKSIAIDFIIVVACSITQNTLFALQIPLIIHVVGYGEEAGIGLFAGALNSAVNLGQLLNTAILSSVFATSLSSYTSCPWPILGGGIITLIAFAFAFTKFHMRMYTM